MAIIIKTILGTNMSLVGGYVTRYIEGSGAAQGKVVNIQLDGGIEIAFWNSDGDSSKQMATRIKLAGIRLGSFLSALVVMKDDKKATGLNFKFNGVWSFSDRIPEATHNGIVMDMERDAESGLLKVSLDTGDVLTFKDNEKGYRMATRAEKKLSIGIEMEAVEQDGLVINFKVDDTWEIIRTINAVVGPVSFVDEGKTYKGVPYVRVNQSVYKGRDDTGKALYDTVYTFFDNTSKAGMIESVRENVKPHSTVAIVCGNGTAKGDTSTYSGYYFVNFKS